MDTKEILSDNIRRFRLKRGLTQRELAERLGVSAKTVSKWETGRGVPELLQLPALSAVLGETADRLLLDPVPPPPQDRRDVFGRIELVYGLSPAQVALAAGVTEAEAEGALMNDLSAAPEEKRQKLGIVLAMLALNIPMFVEKKHILLVNLWSRLRDEAGLSPETVEAYAALPPGKLSAFFDQGRDLTPREEESLFVALFALERVFFGKDCFPFAVPHPVNLRQEQKENV